MSEEFVCVSAAMTEAAGERLGREAEAGDLIGLQGGIGSGKTTFARGIARGIGIEASVTSPTFTLVNQYSGPIAMLHVDVWRLDDADEVLSYIEAQTNAPAITVVEWSDRPSANLLRPDVTIRLVQGDSPNSRLLTAVTNTARGIALATALRASA
ncbi:MAG: tRNA (adenosine(37)-N6)-threonylcarbamoyltransferase complex ATPase subunit type 1 TsaE [Armatimonadetes bacterium]|nr:tRNA (adenosine(37)-N6)-threonylcarbamoyltransferase complex ATPase subunit type 1 TsaE [Armatimonadota bacterium]MDE2205583.1 tRNA (adenosine(37)-N6)-threonylcarbamoyltransferase complex ATPase subunit type 1 TsaE [Armatimonadota bacterium]